MNIGECPLFYYLSVSIAYIIIIVKEIKKYDKIIYIIRQFATKFTDIAAKEIEKSSEKSIADMLKK